MQASVPFTETVGWVLNEGGDLDSVEPREKPACEGELRWFKEVEAKWEAGSCDCVTLSLVSLEFRKWSDLLEPACGFKG